MSEEKPKTQLEKETQTESELKKEGFNYSWILVFILAIITVLLMIKPIGFGEIKEKLLSFFKREKEPKENKSKEGIEC
ncbi:MAG: hypothetical protein QXX95_02005 [Nitrososphaerales archaeon]